MPFSPTNVAATILNSAGQASQHWLLLGTGVKRYILTNASGPLIIYKSLDSGVTWSILDNGNYPGSQYNTNGLIRSQLIVNGGTGDDLILTTFANPRSTSAGATIEFCSFDVGALTWASITHIGGSFSQKTFESLNPTDSPSVHRFRRQDGTEIIAYQCEQSALDGFRRVRVLKLSGSTWTLLHLYGATDEDYILHSAVMDGSENIHLFINHALEPGGGSQYTSSVLGHVSIAASNDAISSFHVLDTDMEVMPATINTGQPTWSTHGGRAACKADSSEIAFGYGWQTFSQYNLDGVTLGTAQELRVARGDLTGDSLNPTWTIDTIATNQPKYYGQFDSISATYDATAKIALEVFVVSGSPNTLTKYGEDVHGAANLKIYWQQIVPYARSGTRREKIFLSEKTGSWSSPAQLWPDPDSSTVSVDGFDVVSFAPTPIVPPITINLDLTTGPLTPMVGSVTPPGPPGPVTNPTECINQ